MPRTYLVFGDIEGKLDVSASNAPSATAGAAITSREGRKEGGLTVRSVMAA